MDFEQLAQMIGVQTQKVQMEDDIDVSQSQSVTLCAISRREVNNEVSNLLEQEQTGVGLEQQEIQECIELEFEAVNQ